jgi:hypothetical protein
MYISVTVIIIYGLYRVAQFLVTSWRRCKTLRAIAGTTESSNFPAGASGTANVTNINIQTNIESLARNSEAIPLQNIEVGSGRDKIPELRRSKRVKPINLTFNDAINVLIGPYFKGEILYKVIYCTWYIVV